MIEGKRKCALQMQRAGNTFLAVIPLARPRKWPIRWRHGNKLNANWFWQPCTNTLGGWSSWD